MFFERTRILSGILFTTHFISIVGLLLTNCFASTTTNSMKCLVNWIPLRIRVRLRNTQPYLESLILLALFMSHVKLELSHSTHSELVMSQIFRVSCETIRVSWVDELYFHFHNRFPHVWSHDEQTDTVISVYKINIHVKFCFVLLIWTATTQCNPEGLPMNGAQLSKGVIKEGMGLSIPTACVRESLQISGALGFSVETYYLICHSSSRDSYLF